jgi:alpha-beta hydrolase superfamily lysophospholipase
MPTSPTRFGCKYKLDQYLQSDPLIYKDGMWTSTAWTMIACMLNFAKQFKNLETPYLLVQSGTDKLVDPFLSVDLDKLSPSKDKTTVLIHDMWHNVWFDDKKDDVMRIIEEWLEERNN